MAPTLSPTPTEASFVNGGRCPRTTYPGLPAHAGCVTTVVSGDESFIVYALLNKRRHPRAWRVRLTTRGKEIDQRLIAGNAFSYPHSVGETDIDADGSQEWWVKVMDFTSHGAPWSRLNLFVARERSLVPVTFDGEPLGVNVGGIARLGEGASCRGNKLVLLRTEAQNVRNTRWRVIERSFELDGDEARFLRRREDMLVIEDYNDPDLDPYYAVNCQGLKA